MGCACPLRGGFAVHLTGWELRIPPNVPSQNWPQGTERPAAVLFPPPLSTPPPPILGWPLVAGM